MVTARTEYSESSSSFEMTPLLYGVETRDDAITAIGPRGRRSRSSARQSAGPSSFPVEHAMNTATGAPCAASIRFTSSAPRIGNDWSRRRTRSTERALPWPT